MAQRRREKRTERSKIDATPPWETRHREEPEPTNGPYDIRDQPEDGMTRVDLGGLRIPATPGLDLRLDVNESQQVISATFVNASGQMQVGVFAAPRNEGIWDDVRSEIRESMSGQGGSAKEHDGPFGTELLGRLKVDGKPTPVRFIGVDGPRWFLRAMLIGGVALDPVKAVPFERVLRHAVVVRGAEPLPVREPVALHLPKEALTLETDDED